jgi:molybdopterin-binding protein
MRLSARNQLQGVITEVHKGATTTIVKVEVRNLAIVSASITNEAANELGLRVGQPATAVIKASDVMGASRSLAERSGNAPGAG